MNTVSLEIAKKLREAGWEKETEFIFLDYGNHSKRIKPNKIYSFCKGYEILTSPTAGELFEELPVGTGLVIAKNKDSVGILNNTPIFQVEEKTLADALALLWIAINK